jgi:flagellar basal body-associated protein FliL
MSTMLILLLVVVAAAVAGWYMMSSEQEPEEAAPPPPSSSYRCKLCGAKSATFAVAHEHASAEHELAGHQIDESIVQE